MKVGLYNLEPQIVNTALMQVSKYHKDKGHTVEIYNKLDHKSYDKIYAFSIFSFTDKGYVTKDMICGGTGFDIYSKLPKEIEDCNYDYSIYPNCDYSILWFSRGCIRKCEFCVVWKKEGFIHDVKPKNLNPNGKYIKVTDNNFFANKNWKNNIKYLLSLNQPIEFQQGIDIRIFNEEQGKALKLLNLKQLYIAWDNPKDDLISQIELLIDYIKPYKITCYILIGYNTSKEEDLFRIEKCRELKINPFVMPFDKSKKYQRDLARYVNMKAIFKSIKFEEYKNKRLPSNQLLLNQTTN